MELGTDPGKVPAGEMTTAVRLCRDCAAKTGVEVGKLPTVPAYGYREEV